MNQPILRRPLRWTFVVAALLAALMTFRYHGSFLAEWPPLRDMTAGARWRSLDGRLAAGLGTALWVLVGNVLVAARAGGATAAVIDRSGRTQPIAARGQGASSQYLSAYRAPVTGRSARAVGVCGNR